MSIASPSDSAWYPDTGATNHVTGDPGILSDWIPYKGSCMVFTGDGTALPIQNIGTANISTFQGHSESFSFSKSKEKLAIC